ncbi:MAG: 50S ribosomal protein L6 [bacterium]|nr:50S ribosomal protein L6 [bacterium]
MSRVGKKLILIPAGVKVEIKGQDVSVAGPKGQLGFKVPDGVIAEIKDGSLSFSLESKIEKRRLKKIPALWGLARNHIANLIEGVVNGYQKALEFEGLGYRAQIENGDLVLWVGFSHPLRVKKAEGIEFSVEKNVIRISGIDKSLVGQTAAKIRKLRPPDAYKAKGIRYFGEVIKKKAGKKATTATTK